MKRRLAGLLAGVIFAASMPLQAMAYEFSDVVGHWAYRAVDRWSDYGVLQGYRGMFKPDSPMTRAEMATVMVNLLGLTETQDENGEEIEFEDMEDEEWYDDAILQCAAAGLLKGDPYGNANPNKSISRQEAAVMMARGLGIDPVYGSLPFSDSEDVGTWASGYVLAMNSRGILNGTGNGFAPQAAITRAELATILNNAISNYASEDGESIEATGNGMTVIAAPNVTITGTLRDGLLATAAADGGTLTLKDARVDGVVTLHSGANLVVSGDTQLTNIVIDKEAENASVTVNKDASVTNIETYAPGVKISGEGTVNTVNANGKNTAITTTGTTVNANAANVTYNGLVVSVNTNSTTSVSNIQPAPVIDANGSYDMDEVIEDYKVTVTQNDSENFTRVKVDGKALKYHENAVEREMGYWCGVAIPAPANASPRYTRYNIADEDDDDAKKSKDGFHEPKVNINDTVWSEITDQDGTSIPGQFFRVYFDRAEYDTVYLTVNWRTSEYDTISTQKYLIDLTGVAAEMYTPTFKTALDSNVVNDSTLQYRQLATSLGVTANVSGTTLTVSGKTTENKLRRSNGNTKDANGYILVAVNYADTDVYSVEAYNNKDNLTRYYTTNYSAKDSSLTNAVLLPVRFFISDRDDEGAFADGDTYTITLYNKDKKEIGKTVLTVKAAGCTYDNTRTSINITKNPEDMTITYGSTANVSVTATVTPTATLSYQWYVDSNSVSGANSASYTIPADRLSVGPHRAYCIISTSDAEVQSSTARITVNAKEGTKPNVTVKASRDSAQRGESIVLEATVSGVTDANLSYRWYMDNNVAMTNSGATSAQNTYVIEDSVAIGDHTFICEVTASQTGFATATGSGSVNVYISAPAAPVPLLAPTVDIQYAPDPMTSAGGSVTLTASVLNQENKTPTGNVTYTWDGNGLTEISKSGNTVTYTLPENTSVDTDQTYSIRCTAQGDGISETTAATSTTVTITVPKA